MGKDKKSADKDEGRKHRVQTANSIAIKLSNRSKISHTFHAPRAVSKSIFINSFSFYKSILVLEKNANK